MTNLLNPKPIQIIDRKGVTRNYILSEIPCIPSKLIVMQYPTSALPKFGDPEIHKKITLELLSYVAVPMPNGDSLRLSTEELCNNHIPDLRTEMRLEREMAMYNWDFFLPDDLSDFWGRLKTMLVSWSQETLTGSSQPSSPLDGQPFTS